MAESPPRNKEGEKEYDDQVVGGFTVLRDKTRKRRSTVQEVLPHWISTPTLINSHLTETTPVDSIPELSTEMRDRLTGAGFAKLFPVQATVIPSLLQCYQYSFNYCRPRDFCVAAPTGSGKTLAYVIPIVQLLLGRCKAEVRVLVVLPVRDLAKQVYDVFRTFTANSDIEVALLAGEKTFIEEQRSLVKLSDSGDLLCRADIVVCTPGRLVDHLHNTDGFHLARLRILVIDEADRVLGDEKQGWFTALDRAIYAPPGEDPGPQSTKRARPTNGVAGQVNAQREFTLQKILLSATLTHDPEPLKQFHLMFPRLFSVPGMSKPEVQPTPNGDTDVVEKTDVPRVESGGLVGTFSTPDGLKEYYVSVSGNGDLKPLFLVHLVRKRGVKRILCFTNSREATHRLCLLLASFDGITVREVSARIPLAKRERLLKQFSEGKIQVLVSSDAMARGIDVNDVDCVVSYDAPPQMKTYVHRVGRTARAGKSGLAYTLLPKNQIHHFKLNLAKVGKMKVRECKYNASQVRKFRPEYLAALKKLESSVQSEQKPSTYGQVNTQDKRRKKGVKPELPNTTD